MITFTSIFTTDVDLLDAKSPPGIFGIGVPEDNKIVERLKNAGVQRRNVDIRASVAWLRQYMYPSYGAGAGGDSDGVGQGAGATKAPSKLRLVLPNSGIGLAGADTINVDSVFVVMTQCDITYEQFFPNGLPRIATVSLGFAEIPQQDGYIRFPEWTEDMAKAVSGANGLTLGYKFTPKKQGGVVGNGD